MKTVIALLSLAALISGCAKPMPEAAIDPPFAFLTLTENQSLATAGPLLTACAGQTPGDRRLCPLKNTVIAGAQAQTAGALFDCDGFRGLRVDWRPSDYAVVVSDLTKTYGIPCSQATTTLKNQYNAVDNVVTMWCFRSGSLTLEKYSDHFTVTRLTYLSDPRYADSGGRHGRIL